MNKRTLPDLSELRACSSEEFCGNALAYLGQAQAVLLLPVAKHEGEQRRSQALSVVIFIVAEGKQFPNLSRKIATGFVSKFLSTLLSKLTPTQASVHNLKLIEIFLLHYSASISNNGILVKSLTDFLLSCALQISVLPPANAILLARCFALLPRLDRPGEKEVRLAENWSNQFTYCLMTAHNCLVHVLNDDKNHSESCRCTDVLPSECLPSWRAGVSWKFPNDSQDGGALERLQFVSNVMIAMIQVPSTSRPLKIPLHQLCCFLECCLLSSEETEEKGMEWKTCSRILQLVVKLVAVVARRISIAALAFLDRLADCAMTAIRIGHTRKNDDEGSTLEAAGFDALSDILEHVGLPVFLTKTNTQLSRIMISDLTQEYAAAPTSSSRTVVTPGSGAKKLAGRKGGPSSENSVDVAVDSTVKRQQYTYRSAAIITAVAKCLHTLMRSYSSRVPVDFYTSTLTAVLGVITRVQAGGYVFPYSTNATAGSLRVCLYSVLIGLLKGRSPLVPRPLHHAVALLSRGLSDPDHGVRAACRDGLAFCEACARPVFPPLEVVSYETESSFAAAITGATDGFSMSTQQMEETASPDSPVAPDTDETQPVPRKKRCQLPIIVSPDVLPSLNPPGPGPVVINGNEKASQMQVQKVSEENYDGDKALSPGFEVIDEEPIVLSSDEEDSAHVTSSPEPIGRSPPARTSSRDLIGRRPAAANEKEDSVSEMRRADASRKVAVNTAVASSDVLEVEDLVTECYTNASEDVRSMLKDFVPI